MNIHELHSIMPIDNIPSVMKHGILSHYLREKLKIRGCSIALEDVQLRRMNKSVPGGMALHRYANLYFDAHNPMLSRVRDRNGEICVLTISASVMELPGVVIADCNASSDYAGFYPYPEGLSKLQFDMIYATYWTHPDDLISEWKHKSIKCAEVLVPERVQTKFISGAYVCNEEAKKRLQMAGFQGNIKVKGSLFF
jgi:hypothetical protein